MKKVVKTVSLLLVLCLAVSAFAACGDTAGKLLKDNKKEAEKQIKAAVEDWIKGAYGDNVTESKVTVSKIYSSKNEKDIPGAEELDIGDGGVAFEASFELKPAEGADTNILTIPDGYLDSESGWIKEKFILGVLRPDEENEGKYKITNFGTGW